MSVVPNWVLFDSSLLLSGKEPGWKQGEGADAFGNPEYGQVKHVMVMKGGEAQYDGILRLEKGGGVFLPVMIGEDGAPLFGLMKTYRPQVKDPEAFKAWQDAWPNITPQMIAELGRESWEIPRGYADLADNTAEDAAVREAEEESGFVVVGAKARPPINDNTALSPHMTGLVIGQLDPSQLSNHTPVDHQTLLSAVTWLRRIQLEALRREGTLYCTFTLGSIGDWWISQV